MPRSAILHAVLTAVGLIVGLCALAWIRPNTSAGATFLIVLAVIVANAIGLAFGLLRAARK